MPCSLVWAGVRETSGRVFGSSGKVCMGEGRWSVTGSRKFCVARYDSHENALEFRFDTVLGASCC